MTRISLPQDAELVELLRLDENRISAWLARRIDQAITAPLQLFLSHDGKALRARTVHAGFRLGSQSDKAPSAAESSACEALSECIEAIHAGSLIVDDIQDGAKVRRGSPALHLTQGLSSALNAGNLLYFLGLRRLATAGLSPEAELACARRLHEDLLRGHYGQALDVGTAIDEVPQSEVAEVSLVSIRLKSGALMSLALTLGAIASGISPERLVELDRFGHSMGMGLQMFDDIKNAGPAGESDPNNVKRLEDLLLRRPSWIWAYAARTCSAKEYAEFVQAVKELPEEAALTRWFEIRDFLKRARAEAREFVEDAFANFEKGISNSGNGATALRELHAIAERFMGA